MTRQRDPLRTLAACLLLAFPAAAAAQTGSWAQRAPMPTGREQAAVAAVGNTIYVFGGIQGNTCTGITTVEAYDTLTDQWTTKAPMPTPRWNPGAVTFNGIVFVIGGSTDCGPRTAAVEAYDPATNTWTTRAPLPGGPRAGVAVAAIGKYIYAVGGSTEAGEFVNTVDIFDPVANAWHPGVPMPTPRANAVAGVINGILYVATGCCVPEAATRLESFDPATGQWTVRASLNQGRVFRPAEGVLNDRFYVAGGNSFGPRPETEMYNPVTDTWSFVAPMLTPRTDLFGTAANGKFYAIGGDLTGNDDVSGANEAFAPPEGGCTLGLDVQYAGGILTMNFAMSTTAPRTWNVWLTFGQNSMIQAWSIQVPALDPAVSFPVAFPLPSLGNLGILTSLSTAAEGPACSAFRIVRTR